MLHAVLLLLFILNLSFVPILLNLPLVAHHILKVKNKRHSYDATEIFRTLPKHKRECLFKLVFYLVSFFYYLYR